MRAIELLTAGPAEVLGCAQGRLAAGAAADLCLFHPDRGLEDRGRADAGEGAEHAVRRAGRGRPGDGHLEGRKARVRMSRARLVHNAVTRGLEPRVYPPGRLDAAPAPQRVDAPVKPAHDFWRSAGSPWTADHKNTVTRGLEPRVYPHGRLNTAAAPQRVDARVKPQAAPPAHDIHKPAHDVQRSMA